MSDTETLQALFDAGGEVQLEPRTYLLERPLVIPPERGLTVSGRGCGISQLILIDGESAIVAVRDRPSGAVTLRDFTVHPGGRSRTAPAIAVTAPTLFAANRGAASELFMERVEVMGAGNAAFTHGIYTDNLGTAKIDKCFAQGRFADVTSEALAVPGAMECAIEVNGSQEAKITNCVVGGARCGVHVHGRGPGRGEGIEVSGCTLVCCDDSIFLEGVPAGTYGGWATPWAVVERNHCFYNRRAVLAVHRSDLYIGPNSFCGSHLLRPAEEQVGIYLVSCVNTRIMAPSFWNPSLSGRVQGYGMVLINCTRGTIHGAVVDPSLRVGAWMVGENPSWRGAGNVWDSRVGMTDQAGRPIVLAAR
jgi:hypothetical protein